MRISILILLASSACLPAKKHSASIPRTGEQSPVEAAPANPGEDVAAKSESNKDSVTPATPTSKNANKSLKFSAQSCEKNPATGLCYVVDATINELSGIAPHSKLSNVFWVHNDEGVGVVFAINTKGELLSRQNLTGITLIDSEDITVGPGPNAATQYVYLGDIGSKGKTAGMVTVIRFAEPNIDPNQKGVTAAVSETMSITLNYPGKKLLDFETMFIDPVDGNLFIVEKGGFSVFKAEKTLLNAAQNGSVVPMTLVRTTGGWVNTPSGGNMSSTGDELILRNETTAWIFRRAIGQSVEDAMGTIAATITLGPEFNGEAICFDNKGIDFYTASENQSKAADAVSPPQPVSVYKRLP